MTLMTDRLDEMHPALTDAGPERPDDEQSRGLGAIPNDILDRTGPSKPTRGLRWRSNEDGGEPPPLC
jgi:hypothetical protein